MGAGAAVTVHLPQRGAAMTSTSMDRWSRQGEQKIGSPRPGLRTVTLSECGGEIRRLLCSNNSRPSKTPPNAVCHLLSLPIEHGSPGWVTHQHVYPGVNAMQ